MLLSVTFLFDLLDRIFNYLSNTIPDNNIANTIDILSEIKLLQNFTNQTTLVHHTNGLLVFLDLSA